MAPKIESSGQIAIVLTKLADIQSSLAINTTETANIKNSVAEIKNDIKEIKNDFVTRRELTEALQSVRDEISPLKKFVFGLIGFVMLAVLGAVINLILMNGN